MGADQQDLDMKSSEKEAGSEMGDGEGVRTVEREREFEEKGSELLENCVPCSGSAVSKRQRGKEDEEACE